MQHKHNANKIKKFKSKNNTPKFWVKKFPWKKLKGHKYSRGKVVIYGGKREFTGASILAAEASLRTGTGSTRIICNRDTLKIFSLKFSSVLKSEINNTQFSH